MTKRKCFGCEKEFKEYQCTYTTKGIITNCPCFNCLVKSNCTKLCLEFIDRFLNSPNREFVFEDMYKTLKKTIEEK